MLKKRYSFLALIALIPLSFILTQCYNSTPADPRGEIYAGSESCKKCHSDVYSSFLHTAHFQTSQLANIHNIRGSFAKDSNTFEFGMGQKIIMKKRNDSLYQVGYLNGKETEAEPFDVSIGNGKAQTYMYWKGKMLYELPVSYFATIHNWANSPGYLPDRMNFGRPILRRCLECHSSYVKELPPQAGDFGFEKASLIYGIDCERCHGPAANHVNYHTDNPDDKKAKYIATYASLSRTQKMDACAVCHSGNKNIPQRSSFEFEMGDTLLKDRTQPRVIPGSNMPDVHGNQYDLLIASKCYTMSKMDCGNCHNPHVSQPQSMVTYTQKCLSCHSEANHNFCKLAPQMGTAIKTYCIDCHMPNKASNVIRLEAAQSKMKVPYMVRSHYIGIYPEETKKILDFVNGKKGV
ncbi:cytochrome c3 family protein [Mucilaginibacter kameinonensis]|uniref:cytochrome c3 family protein n=1 Tax=Mucilaginibacter kameinonensis TaxID=452286 RepID=UPI000EF812B2|nr:cytochrome c3 family protein [Mucilaginibacter kameinonensis]